MSYDTAEPSRDWLASTSSSLLAWWIPQAAMLGGLFVSTPVRVIVWTLALVWMGTACFQYLPHSLLATADEVIE
jgi:hypothetical protein